MVGEGVAERVAVGRRSVGTVVAVGGTVAGVSTVSGGSVGGGGTSVGSAASVPLMLVATRSSTLTGVALCGRHPARARARTREYRIGCLIMCLPRCRPLRPLQRAAGLPNVHLEDPT
jgi:hypothetical protein